MTEQQAIWKYQFDINEFMLEMPRGAKVLAVQMQGPVPCLWALVDPDAKVSRRHFHVVGTGQSLNAEAMTYIGTFQEPPFVWHLFEATR